MPRIHKVSNSTINTHACTHTHTQTHGHTQIHTDTLGHMVKFSSKCQDGGYQYNLRVQPELESRCPLSCQLPTLNLLRCGREDQLNLAIVRKTVI